MELVNQMLVQNKPFELKLMCTQTACTLQQRTSWIDLSRWWNVSILLLLCFRWFTSRLCSPMWFFWSWLSLGSPFLEPGTAFSILSLLSGKNCCQLTWVCDGVFFQIWVAQLLTFLDVFWRSFQANLNQTQSRRSVSVEIFQELFFRLFLNPLWSCLKEFAHKM